MPEQSERCHRISFRHPAPEGDRFAPDAFANTIGGQITVDLFGVSYAGTTINAEVVEDGAAVMITFDVDTSEELRA